MRQDFEGAQGITMGPLLRHATQVEGSDAADEPATDYVLPVGDIFEGGLESGSAEDWVAVELQVGESYVFSVWGTGGSSAGLDDTMLTLHSASGQQVAVNDDLNAAAGVDFSLIEYTASSTGTYYLGVSSVGGEVGAYRLQAAENVYTLDQMAGFITEFNWGLATPVRFDAMAGESITYDVSALTTKGRQLAEWALESWSQASGLSFVTVGSGTAQLVFEDAQNGAFAGPVAINPETGANGRSTINIGTDWLQSYGTTIDSYAFQTYLHEIGHALGLGHAGPYDGAAQYGEDNIYLNDSNQLTLMSYFGPEDNDFVTGDDLVFVTPMMVDLLALQALYGTASAHAGDTVWGANATVTGWLGDVMGHIFDGDTVDAALYGGEAIGLTLFDTGGIDTLDLSSVTVAQRIDLRAERFSDVNGSRANLAIARGTVIEKAIGGFGADRITGNDADNEISGAGGHDSILGGGGHDLISGGAGNDTLHGGQGDDTLTAGSGNNTISGGLGTDLAMFNLARGDVTIQQQDEFLLISANGISDSYTGVEFFQFTDGRLSAAELTGAAAPEDGPQAGNDGDDTLDETPDETGNDTIIGTAANDTLSGGDGDDAIAGGDGADMLYGNGGNDMISGAGGDDFIEGGAGHDNIGGGLGNDTIDGGAGNDVIGAGHGDDQLRGGLGHDTLAGGAGNDTILGGAGDDMIGASYGNDSVEGGKDDDDIGGGTGKDTISGGAGDDRIGGGEGDDIIYGNDGGDFLAGGGRNDVIHGGSGADTLNGGTGDDVLTGGTGADFFVFNTLNMDEVDYITDFEAGVDKIRISGVQNAPGSGLQGYVDALAPSDVSEGASLTYGGHTIILELVSAAEIQAGDFVFV
ncbi:M10 family metallopeptidase C-terminal domain-containing protein [Sulfitobacter aestuarii]|uniref:M10 family metallopeptidase C-terminal domain-containing protein n=1 Tax=Sulfitobacter aestuarii TaxID=2161676 RepID=A0ABW5U6M2_9RHOB